MFPADCCWRSFATQGLEQLGIDYHIAYSSASLTGLQAAVKAGLAITVLSQSSLPADLKKIPDSVGLPQLPPVSLVLTTNPHGNQLLIEALANHIIAAVDTLNHTASHVCQCHKSQPTAQ